MQTHACADRGIGGLAETQYGVVSRGQLFALGVGRGGVRSRLASGRLHRLHAGVYAVGHRVLSSEGQWMAAVLAGGSGTVLSHRSAAALWGIREHSGPIEITTPRKTRSRGSIRRHCARLVSDEVTRCRGIPTTSAPRTLFDLAADLRIDRLEAAIRQAEFLRLWDPLSLPTLIARHPGHRGNASLRLCLERLGRTTGFTRSDFEELFLPFVDQFGLPRPHLNAWLEVGGGWIEVDCLWRDARLIVELDSRAAHETRSAFETDRDRDRRLQADGWRVVRMTWRQLHDAPGALAQDLRAMLQDAPHRQST